MACLRAPTPPRSYPAALGGGRRPGLRGAAAVGRGGRAGRRGGPWPGASERRMTAEIPVGLRLVVPRSHAAALRGAQRPSRGGGAAGGGGRRGGRRGRRWPGASGGGQGSERFTVAPSLGNCIGKSSNVIRAVDLPKSSDSEPSEATHRWTWRCSGKKLAVVRVLRPAPWLFQVAEKAKFTGLICWRLGRVDQIAWKRLKSMKSSLSTQLYKCVWAQPDSILVPFRSG